MLNVTELYVALPLAVIAPSVCKDINGIVSFGWSQMR
jgi:hypothetical protein